VSKGRIVEALSDMALFRFLNAKELELLAMVMSEVTVSAGDAICTEGDAGSTCFFIVRGVVDVRKNIGDDDDRVITTLREGQLFGHLALVDTGPRTATCVAATTTRLLVLERDDFDTLFSNNTRFAFKFQDVIARTAAQQLRLANERLTMIIGQAPVRHGGAGRSAAEIEQLRSLSRDMAKSGTHVKLD
jgi:CRP/FNR family transcriptional regulator, cyclic AMP receptor protein